MLEKIEAGPRAPMYAHELIIGAKCGGSDFTSGIAGNAVIGKFFENLTAAGGTAKMCIRDRPCTGRSQPARGTPHP